VICLNVTDDFLDITKVLSAYLVFYLVWYNDGICCLHGNIIYLLCCCFIVYVSCSICWQMSDGNSCDSRDTNGNKCAKDDHVALNENEKAVITHSFDFPTEMCGRLIGQRGRNVATIKEKSGAEIFIRAKQYDTCWQVVSLEGETLYCCCR